jgi:UDP-N-acetyl-2-amino-2-deoxyglucuronate dehydrogenase
MDGGVLSQQAVHHLDALRWIGGEIDSVEARCATQLVDMECEDTCVATVVFQSGALGAIEAMTSARPADIEASVSILGEKGAIVIGGLAMNRIEHWKFSEPRPDDETIPSRCSVDVPNAYGFGHDDLFTRVARSVAGDAPVEIDGRAGLETLRLLHALYASHERGIRVRLNEAPVSAKLGLP